MDVRQEREREEGESGRERVPVDELFHLIAESQYLSFFLDNIECVLNIFKIT